MKAELTKNIDKIHTTDLGLLRIQKNLKLDEEDIILYCKQIIENENSNVRKKGKNYYVNYENIELTVNASSFTIITAHLKS